MLESLNNLIKNDDMSKFVYSIILSIAFILLYNIFKALIVSIVKKPEKQHSIKRNGKIIFVLIYFVILFVMLYSEKVNYSMFFGLFSAGMAISLKDILADIAAWMFILIKKPFRVGHRIEINGIKGDVVDIGLLRVSLMEVIKLSGGEQESGKMVHVPNFFALTYPVINYNKGLSYIWKETEVLLTLESDWEKAEKIFLNIIEQESEYYQQEQDDKKQSRYLIRHDILTPLVYYDVKDSGIMLTLRYMVDIKKGRRVNSDIWKKILQVCHENPDIELAYPTSRIVMKN